MESEKQTYTTISIFSDIKKRFMLSYINSGLKHENDFLKFLLDVHEKYKNLKLSLRGDLSKKQLFEKAKIEYEKLLNPKELKRYLILEAREIDIKYKQLELQNESTN